MNIKQTTRYNSEPTERETEEDCKAMTMRERQRTDEIREKPTVTIAGKHVMYSHELIGSMELKRAFLNYR